MNILSSATQTCHNFQDRAEWKGTISHRPYLSQRPPNWGCVNHPSKDGNIRLRNRATRTQLVSRYHSIFRLSSRLTSLQAVIIKTIDCQILAIQIVNCTFAGMGRNPVSVTSNYMRIHCIHIHSLSVCHSVSIFQSLSLSLSSSLPLSLSYKHTKTLKKHIHTWTHMNMQRDRQTPIRL